MGVGSYLGWEINLGMGLDGFGRLFCSPEGE